MNNLQYLLLITLVAGCAKPESSQVKHNTNEPVRANSDFFFAERSKNVKDLYYKKTSKKDKPEIPRDNFVADTHPFAVRVQFWVDKLDAIIRSQDPKATLNVPKPKAMVGMRQDFNANVKSHVYCYSNLNAVINESMEGEGEVVDNVEDLEGYDLCNSVHAEKSEEKIEIAKTWLLYKGISCEGESEVSEKGKTSTVSVSGCEADGEQIDEKVVVKGLYVFKTSPYITIYSGLFTGGSEEVLVGVLAHELAHYYRTHPSLVGESRKHAGFGYYYRITGHEGDGKPVQAVLTDDEKELIENLWNVNKAVEGYKGSKKSDEYKEMVEALELLEELVTEAKIGQYTAEQEADQLAAEWLHLLGFDPRNFSEFWAGIGGDSCKKSFESDWKDEAGELLVRGVGTLVDTHHDGCFRAFSTDRDVINHGFVAPKNGYQGARGVEGYEEIEALSPYSDSQKLVDEFFKEETVHENPDVESISNTIKSFIESLQKVTAGRASVSNLLNLNFALKSPSAIEKVNTNVSSSKITLSGGVSYDQPVGNVTLPSVVSIDAELKADSCEFSSDMESLTEIIASDDVKDCLNSSKTIEGYSKVTNSIEFTKSKLKYDYGKDLTLEVSGDKKGPFVVKNEGNSLHIDKYMEEFTGTITYKPYYGLNYKKTIILNKGSKLVASDVIFNETGINAKVIYDVGGASGSFDLVEGEITNLK